MTQTLRRDSRGRFTSELYDECPTIVPRKYIKKYKKNNLNTKKKLTYIAVVLDKSSSMIYIRNDTIKAYNNLLNNLKKEQVKTGQEIQMSTFGFSDKVSVTYHNSPIERCFDLYNEIYVPYGNTALYDGVGEAINYLSKLPTNGNFDVSYLVFVITDGMENRSTTYTSYDINKLIKDKNSTDKWTFVFSVPVGYKNRLIDLLDIPEGNVQEWEQNASGIKDKLHFSNSVGASNYFNARCVGIKSVSNFYTDLSKLSKSSLVSKLKDISDEFRSYTVEKECSIKEFVENKTKNPYILGFSFYNLTKKEEIQPQKEILIMEKNKKEIWGGREARDLIGLPHDCKVKVIPGNHANYDIYVQSTSVNRKLVRGTKVLIRKV